MSNLIAISKSKHKNWGFNVLKNFSVVGNQSACQISFSEIKKVSRFAPLFLHKNKTGNFNLCCLNGFFKDNNSYVSKEGHWIGLGGYIPAVYRSLPFYVKYNEKKTPIICFDEDLNCVVKNDKDIDCTPFFEKDGEISKKFNEFLSFIYALTKDLERTSRLVNELNQAELITEWKLSIKNKKNEEQPIKGLYTISEEKLNDLSNEHLCKLFKSKAIELAYAQIYSIDNLNKLITIHEHNLKVESKQQANINIREKAVEKQKKAQKKEMDDLVKNLMSDD